MTKRHLILLAFLAFSASLFAQQYVLKADNFKHYIDYFNRMETPNIEQAIPNAKAWDWMKVNIPLFECPQDNFEEMYYFRWWTIRKHIKQTPQGYAFTEFLVNRTYADKYNLISSALGHHIYEARWIRDTSYLNQYIHLWFRGNEGKPLKKLRAYSGWNADAIYNRYLVDFDKKYLLDMLPDLTADFAGWEAEKRHANGLFWQFDVRDGMEETVSGGRKDKNARPTINSYMYGNAKAISAIASLAGKTDIAEKFRLKADTIKRLVEEKLWSARDTFFETHRANGDCANAREAIGFIPWYFNLPDNNYSAAWHQVTDPLGFLAPFGLTTAERRHPLFRTHGCCKCEWDGAVWPFATAQTLTAMANLLNNYQQNAVDKIDYFNLLQTYVESMHYRGRPYVGEYLDEKTGYWLKGDEERSRYYNHSTFNDLIISGLVGLRPRPDNIIEINPLIPEDKWDWFCLDKLLYHGKNLTIIWDKTGEKYKKGKGLQILVNGKKVAGTDKLARLTATL
ncbi:MAG: glycoside hydrolase [Bacteroidota bacterium]|nr:glycoside hydrolase [Bacteroidota bacterium]